MYTHSAMQEPTVYYIQYTFIFYTIITIIPPVSSVRTTTLNCGFLKYMPMLYGVILGIFDSWHINIKKV